MLFHIRNSHGFKPLVASFRHPRGAQCLASLDEKLAKRQASCMHIAVWK